MLIFLLVIAIALVAWSLHLMQEALDRQEFSLMLAGTLVAFSAAAIVGIYLLMNNYMGYLTQITHQPVYDFSAYDAQVVISTQSAKSRP